MHTDVGGGYKEKELSDIVLEWMVQHAVKHGLLIFNSPKGAFKGTCTPDPNGKMHDSRNTYWKKKIFPAKQRTWDEKQYENAVIHESVKMRTASKDNESGAGYRPWILNHEHEIEKWTHLSDWMKDPEFQDVDPATFSAIEGWYVPPDRDR